MDLTIAWIAQGRMRIKSGSEPARTIESKYGEGIRERAGRKRGLFQRNAIYLIGAGGKREVLVREAMIQQVVVLNEAAN